MVDDAGQEYDEQGKDDGSPHAVIVMVRIWDKTKVNREEGGCVPVIKKWRFGVKLANHWTTYINYKPWLQTTL